MNSGPECAGTGEEEPQGNEEKPSSSAWAGIAALRRLAKTFVLRPIGPAASFAAKAHSLASAATPSRRVCLAGTSQAGAHWAGAGSPRAQGMRPALGKRQNCLCLGLGKPFSRMRIWHDDLDQHMRRRQLGLGRRARHGCQLALQRGTAISRQRQVGRQLVDEAPHGRLGALWLVQTAHHCHGATETKCPCSSSMCP